MSLPHEPEPGAVEAVEHVLDGLTRGGDGASARIDLLSDLNRQAAKLLRERWDTIPTGARRTLVQRMRDDAELDVTHSYGRVMRVALSDADNDTRLAAVEGLWEYNAVGLLDELLALLGRESDERIRAAVVETLSPYVQRAETGDLDEADARRLVDALLDIHERDASSNVRRRALESASHITGDQRVVQAIRLAYESGQHDLRVSALRAMGNQCDAAWLSICHHELRSDEPEIRYEAVTAVGSIMDERSAPLVLDLLGDDDVEVQMAAIAALGSIGGSVATNALRRIVREEEDIALVEAAEDALDEAQLSRPPMRMSPHMSREGL